LAQAPPAATDEPARRSSWERPRVLALVLAGMAVFVALARALVVARRIPAPLDLLVWAESPFLTNLLKLTAGVPIYTDPAEANSFIYSPGLEYICYGLLAPLGLELDIRFCRLVSVGVGVLAAAFAAATLADVEKQVFGAGTNRARSVVAFAAIGAVLFANFTASSTHPDNLFTLHAALVVFLSYRARVRKSLPYAIAAVAVAGCGIWAKQTASLSLLGALLALLSARAWTWRQRAQIAAAGIGAGLVAAAVLLAPVYNRFYLFEVLSGQPLQTFKVVPLFLDFLVPHRLLLVVAGVVGAVRLIRRREEAVSDWLLVWAALGAFEVLPSIVGYLRTFGTSNNLFAIDVWLMLLVWPALNVPIARQGEGALKGWLAAGFVLALATSLFPVDLLPESWARDLTPVFRESQPMPTVAYQRYAQRYGELVRRDLEAGKRVLVAHGTTVLVRAGVKEVPIDRMNSVLELVGSGLADRAHTLERIRARRYDRIYVPQWPLFHAGWYGPEVEQALKEHYRGVDVIPSANEFVGERSIGRLALMVRVAILEPVSSPP
jgi:hypothetical protein